MLLRRAISTAVVLRDATSLDPASAIGCFDTVAIRPEADIPIASACTGTRMEMAAIVVSMLVLLMLLTEYLLASLAPRKPHAQGRLGLQRNIHEGFGQNRAWFQCEIEVLH